MPRVDPIPELKRQCASALVALLAEWNAHDIATYIGTDQPRISDLRRGKLDRFSLETLIRYLVRLRRRVDLSITEEPARRRTP